MRDITDLLNTYRECVRHLWNTYLLQDISLLSEWDAVDEFDDISTRLFALLVLAQIDRGAHEKSQASLVWPEPLLFLRVVPRAEAGIPIHVIRDKKSSQYWDHSLSVIRANEADMRFIDFYDFDRLGFREFQHCRVRIVSSDKNSDLVGRDALLGCNHVRILFDETV